MDIRYIPREEIDKVKWNSCVHYAPNGNIFGYMWFLDQVAKDWDALVEGDYESVLPLVWREDRRGRKRLEQPPWMRELGVYSVNVLSRPRIKAFVDAIPEEYASISMHLNEQNFLPEAEGYALSPQTNYQLLLNAPYEEIAGQFSKEWFLQLDKASKGDLKQISNIKPEAVADFFRKHADGPDRESRAHALLRIMYNVLHRGWGYSAGVTDANGELLAANFFIFSHGKALSLAPVVSPRGRDLGALEALFHMFIETQANKPLLLDLNSDGSDGLAEGMGAKPNSFFKLEKNTEQPPAWRKWLASFRIALVFFAVFALASCGKEKIEPLWERQDSGTDYPLNAVYFLDEQTGYAVGGDTWRLGISLHTNDGGETWQADSMSNKRVFALHFNRDRVGVAAGIDGNVFRRNGQDPAWNQFRYPVWKPYWGAAKSDSASLLVGGQAYKDGVIVRLGADFQIDTVCEFVEEINAVSFVTEQTAIAVGYGVVLRSEDGGRSWTPLPVVGDHFRAVHFPSERVGYIAGYSGAIFKTEDGGKTWQQLRKGGGIRTPYVHFRSVFFTDEETGYLAGENGVVWKTENGGAGWSVFAGLPDIDYYGVYAIGKRGWLVGENGAIIHFRE
jgi:photosystem II stability/assembly factor-like uncharacterized protein